jgi:hypothetical protein
LHCLGTFSTFKIAIEFLQSEFGHKFVREFLLTGKRLFRIQKSIIEFTKLLNLFKNNFDKEFVKEFLMRKRGWLNANFFSRFSAYSKPENCSDLLKLFDLIFSICGADSELFSYLLLSKSKSKLPNNQTFFMELKENYKMEEFKLKLVIDWIDKNLGHDFLIDLFLVSLQK